jgi:hypothetical protein
MPIDEVERELNAMLDEGVRVRLTDQEPGAYRLLVIVRDQSCADCLVPDATLRAIAADALGRRGLVISSVTVEHAV